MKEEENEKEKSTFIDYGHITESSKCDVIARKVVFKRLQKEPITNKAMTLYNLDRNASVEITEKYECEGLPESPYIHREVGDKIVADAISLFIDTKRKISFDVKEGVSGRHGANLTDCKYHSIGRINRPLDIYKSLLGFSTKAITE